MLLQGRQRNPGICPSTAALCVHQEPHYWTQLPFLSPSLGSPQQGRSGESLIPNSPEGLQPSPPWSTSGRLDPAPPPGGSVPCHTQLTHQHLSYTVLLPNIAEVPRHVGLEPDMLSIRRRLLDRGMSMLSAHLPPSSPASPCPDPPTLPPPRETWLNPPQSTFLHPVFPSVPTTEGLAQTWPPQEVCPDPTDSWAPLAGAHGTSTLNCSCGPGPGAHMPLSAPSYSHSSPQCSGCAALARTGPREQAVVPGAGGLTC